MEYRLKTPLDKSEVAKLKVGDVVYISGKLLTGRDAAHKRIFEAIRNGQSLPFDIKGQAIYYVGPCEKDGKVLSAEHIAPEVIKVTYVEDGKTKMLVFDGTTGDFIVQ